jgi:hypothetical protein
MLRRLPALVRYLHEEQPDAMLCAGTQSNLAGILARRIADIPTRVVVSEHNTLSRVARYGHGLLRGAYPSLIHRYYPEVDAIIAVSEGVAKDLAGTADLPERRITRIYNPVDIAAVSQASSEPVGHPWLADKTRPVILAAGRLHRQKDLRRCSGPSRPSGQIATRVSSSSEMAASDDLLRDSVAPSACSMMSSFRVSSTIQLPG